MAGGEATSHSEGMSQEQQGESGQAQPELGTGEVMTVTGRVSAARRVLPGKPKVPFSTVQLASLDEALTLASRTTGLDFSLYLGDLGADTRATAEQLHAMMGQRAAETVLVAVSPGQRAIEVVTGEESVRRLPDRGCKLAVMNMAASFAEGELAGGLLNGLRILADQAGTPPRR